MKSLGLQLRCELEKLFGRKRTYLGFGVFVVVEFVLMGLFHLRQIQAAVRPAVERTGFDFDKYFSGLTLAFFSLYWANFLIGSLYLAMVSGDIVAKEWEEGTLRMIFCRRISRKRLLAVKVMTCAIYSVSLTFFIGITALLAGFFWQGTGGLMAIVPQDKFLVFHDFWPGLGRYLCCLPFQARTDLTFVSLGFMLSCCNVKPVTATIGTLSFFFIDFVMRNVPYFHGLAGYFITTHMAMWKEVLLPHVPWAQLVENYALLLAVDATCLWIGLLVFEQRDFKA